MHQSVIDFLKRSLTKEEVHGKSVVEVGSRIVFGSPRETVQWLMPGIYVGVDLMDGKGVDVVLPAEQLSSRFDGVDVVIATELLEHIEFWKKAIAEMKKILKPGGLLLVTARGPGFPYHPHPGDFWRFDQADFRKIFSDMEILTLEDDPQADHPGVFLKARKPEVFVPATLMFDVRSVG